MTLLNLIVTVLTLLTSLIAESNGDFVRICESDRDPIGFGCENLSDFVKIHQYESYFILHNQPFSCDASYEKLFILSATSLQIECIKQPDKSYCELGYAFYKNFFKSDTSIDGFVFNQIPIRIQFNYTCEFFTTTVSSVTETPLTTITSFNSTHINTSHSTNEYSTTIPNEAMSSLYFNSNRLYYFFYNLFINFVLFLHLK